MSKIAVSARAYPGDPARPNATAAAPAPQPPPAAPAPAASPPAPAFAVKLNIQFDSAAQRYVQTILDQNDGDIVSRYPSTSQLAFSAGANAYQQALWRALKT
jgi:hypothetical protein